jgi:hypothetical protein
VAIDPNPVMDRIVAVLQGLTGMQQVVKGVPAALTNRVSAYVTLDAWRVFDSPAGVLRHEVDVGVTFGYRVAGTDPDGTAVAAAEQSIGTTVGRFVAAYAAERRGGAGSLAALVGATGMLPPPDFSRAAEPQYATVAGQENRLYPGTVRVTYEETW